MPDDRGARASHRTVAPAAPRHVPETAPGVRRPRRFRAGPTARYPIRSRPVPGAPAGGRTRCAALRFPAGRRFARSGPL